MSSAFGEPPVSGVRASAKAAPAKASSAARATRRARRGDAPGCWQGSGPRRADSIHSSADDGRRWRDYRPPNAGGRFWTKAATPSTKSGERGHLLLDLGLELELLVHPRVQPVR